MVDLTVMAQQPRLVGREGELRLLEGRLDEAFAGRGSLVLVSGEAGIGKSSLADEFGKHAAKRGASVLVGKCIPTATSPYLPFEDALQKLTLSKRELGLVGWLKGSRLAVGKEDSVALGLTRELNSGRTLYLALEFFRRASEEKALLLVLDDLHWADSSTIELLHFLARNCRNVRVLIVGTYRPEDLGTRTEGKTHPLLESLTTMRREGIVFELELDRLSLRELRSLIESLIGVPPEEEVLKRIQQESGGNPLFAVEVIRLLTKAEEVRIEGGSWRIVGQIDIDIPSTIKDLVMRRLDQLPKEERRVLECASVIGELFNSSVLIETLGTDKIELLEALDSLQRNSQLVRATERGYRFSHEKIRQVTYQSVSAPRRKELHQRIGKVLESPNAEGSLLGELSTHFCRAGDSEKCTRYSLLAGKESLNRYAFREAAEQFHTAIESARDKSSLRDELLEALEGIADSQVRLGFPDEARQHYERYLESYTTQKERARVLRKLADYWIGSMKADFSMPLHLLDEAEKSEGIERVEIGRIASLRGYIAFMTGAYDTFEKQSSIARSIFEEIGAAEDLADLLLAKTEVLLSTGRISDALTGMERADKIYSDIGNPRKQVGCAWDLGLAYFHLGMVNEALDSYQKGLDISSKYGFSHPRLHFYKGLVYYSIDDFDSAMVEAVRGIDECAKSGAAGWQAAGMALSAICKAHLNRLSEAEEELRQSSELLKSITTGERTPLRAWQILAQAELYGARKEWLLSNEQFQSCIESVKGTAFQGLLLEARARTRFGEALTKQGLTREAMEQFAQAASIYGRLGNKSQLAKIKKLEAVLPAGRNR